MACNIFVNDNEASDDPAFEKCGPRREMIGFELLVYGMIEEIARNFVRKTWPYSIRTVIRRHSHLWADVVLLTHQSSRSGGLLRRVA